MRKGISPERKINMYKENLERFLATQLKHMRILHSDKDCLYRLYNQAFGACLFINDSLYAAGGKVEDEWLVELWQNFEDKVRKEFKLDV